MTLLGQQLALSATEGLTQAVGVGTAIFAQSAAVASNPMYGATQLAGAAKGFNSQPQPSVVVVNGNGTPAQPTQLGSPASNVMTAPVKSADAAKKAEAKKDAAAAKMKSSWSMTRMLKKKADAAKEMHGTISVTEGEKASTETKTEQPKEESTPETEALAEKKLERKKVETKPETSVDKKAAPKPASKTVTSKPKDEINGKFYPADPAMSAISIIYTNVSTIEAIVNEVCIGNWARILAPEVNEGQPNQLSDASTCKFNLEKKQRDFQPDLKGLASQLTVRILKDSIAVATELLTEAKKSSNINEWVKPEGDSDQVQSWVDRIERCSNTCLNIKQSADSTPGLSLSGAASLFPKKSEAELTAATSQRSNLMEQTIRSHTLKLTSTQEVYKSATDTYKAVIQESAKMKQELDKVKAEIVQLKLDQITSVK